jgi:hypothetical protein
MEPMAPPHDPRLPLSEVLRRIGDQPEPTISVGDLAERFGGRATGALLLVFGLACTLPLPPGATTIFGAPLVLLAPQVAFGAASPWLPVRLRTRSMRVEDLRRGLPRAVLWLERIEAVSRPRLPFLFGAWGYRVIGAVCTVLALVLILPIPLGNMLPAAAVSVLSLSLVLKDGFLALLGYALAGCSAGVLLLAGGLIWAVAERLLGLFGMG